MRRQFIHNLFSSFTLWFEHTLLAEGETYTNTSGNLYYMQDDIFANYKVYASPFKQWTYDASISGAQIPSGVYVNGNFVPRGTSGLHIDYKNGRAIFESGQANWAVSGEYSVKDFNVYRTTEPDEILLFNNRFMFNPEFPQALTGVQGKSIIAPAIFLKLNNFDNTPFQFGGTDESNVQIRAVIVSDSEFGVDGVGNIFADQKYKNFVLFPTTPLNEFNDIKSGNSYNYLNDQNTYFSDTTIPYIAEVNFSKLLSIGFGRRENFEPNVRVGFLDFTIKLPR